MDSSYGGKLPNRFQSALDPSRLESGILKNYSLKAQQYPLHGLLGSTSSHSLKSSLVDNLIKKNREIVSSSSSKIAPTSSANLLHDGRKDRNKRLKIENDIPAKKLKRDVTITASGNVKKTSGKFSKKLMSKETFVGFDQKHDEDISDDKDEGSSRGKVFTDVKYDDAFEKLDCSKKFKYSFQAEHSYGPLEDLKVTAEKRLLEMVSVSLIKSTSFRKKHDDFRNELVVEANCVADKNPEFVLKLVLYTRKHLNIRTTSNFLLAYASIREQCKPYLEKYFNSCVILPSDWIEIAELSLTFGKDRCLALPSVLRRVMAKKFPEFDKYQLGKYNKEKARMNKNKTKIKKPQEEPTAAATTTTPGKKRNREAGKKRNREADKKDEESFDVPHFTLKQLIRKLHISEPVDNVMSIIGKRYPATMDEFYRSRLPGLFEEEKAGKRMKLPVPETWETQLSKLGNSCQVWATLIDNKKLPFMAMLRNLKNIILSNVSEKYHKWVLGKLTDEGTIIYSKQFPFRFFSAYSVLDNLEEGIKKVQASAVVSRRRRGVPADNNRLRRIDKRLLQRYRNALDVSVQIAIMHNVPPISGRTIIFCDLSGEETHSKMCPTATGIGKSRTIGEMVVLMSLMCKYACEESTLFVCGTKSFEEVQIQHKESILKNMECVLKLESVVNQVDDKSISLISHYINNLNYNKEQVQNWIFLNGHGGGDLLKLIEGKFSTHKSLVSPNLQGYFINLGGNTHGVSNHGYTQINGFSDQVLRFIAERSDTAQLTYVENIDRLYKLEDTKQLKKLKSGEFKGTPFVHPPHLQQLPRWANCRIFISSTFLDMFSERDILVKYIFKELKERSKSVFVNIFEVDLRWGVTEEQTQNNKTIELCLSEVMKCQFFVGVLGQRYGWCPDNYEGIDLSRGMEWINKHPKGASLTELEFYQCFNSLDFKNKAFFYFRDPSFLKDTPKKYHHLIDDNSMKLKALKKFVINSGAEVLDNYPCTWGGVGEDGKPIIIDLEEFGNRVLNNLWNAILKAHPERERMMRDITDLENLENALHTSYVDFLTSRFIGRQNLINKGLDLLRSKKSGIILVTGKPGSGKSALMASIFQNWQDTRPNTNGRVLIHCVGASPRSDNIILTLLRLTSAMDSSLVYSNYWKTGSYELACKLFQNSLKMVKKTDNATLHVFVDGVDYFSDEHNARLMTWLPEDIPENVIIIISTNENSESHLILKNRASVIGTMDIGTLNSMDKQDIVRKKLKAHSKTLDESAFNNQMKLMTTKEDSTSPLYLTLLCDEMIQFGDFENVSKKIFSLPSTLPKLLQDKVKGLETYYGEEFVRTALCSLVCSRQGLNESELQEVLSTGLGLQWKEVDGYTTIGNQVVTTDNFISPVRVLSFIRSIQHFIRPTSVLGDHVGDVTVSICHKDVVPVVRQRYLNSIEGRKYEKFIHMLLTYCYYRQADPNFDKQWKNIEAPGFASITYHMAQYSDYQGLSELLTDLSFIQLKFRLSLSVQLRDDFNIPYVSNVQKRKEQEHFISSKRFKDYRNFVYKNSHLLEVYPQLTIQQALLENDDSEPYKDATRFLLENPSFDLPCARWENKDQFDDLCVQTINTETASCLALSSDDRTLAAGFSNALIKIFNTQEYKEISTLIGHSTAITSVCFVSNVRLCSASKDNTLSLWDITGSFRLAVLEGHKRQVSSCVSDNIGRIIVSVGWDCVINVWHGVTGALEIALPRDKRPFNCVSIHPEGQLVVVGGWDSTLKIWDLIQKCRRAMLRGHSGSVRDVRFNVTGIQIASADIFGEVRIWSAQQGCLVGLVKGHSMPINKILYTPSGGELVTASDDGTIKIWSESMGHCTHVFGEMGHGPATYVAFDPLPSTILPTVAVGYHQGSVRMFSCVTGLLVWENLHTGAPVSIKCLSYKAPENPKDPKILVIGKADGTCELVNVQNGKQVCVLGGHSGPLSSIVCTDDCIITAGEDFFIFIYNYSDVVSHRGTSSQDPHLTLEGHEGAVTGLALNSDKTELASVGRDRAIIIWDLGQRKVMKRKINNAHSDWITTCSWSNCADYLVTGSNDFNLRIWHVPTGQLKHTLRGHSSMVNGVSYKYGCIVSSSVDGSLKVWSHKGLYLSTLHSHQVKCNSCDLYVSLHQSTDSSEYKDWEDAMVVEDATGTRKKSLTDGVKAIAIASCYDDGSVRIWNPLESDQRNVLVGHVSEVVSLTSGHGGLMCSGSMDGCLKIWKVPNVRQVMTGLSSVTVIVVSPSGNVICAATRSGMIKVWMKSQFLDSKSPSFSIQVSNRPIMYLHFPTDDSLISATEDKELALWRPVEKKGALSLELITKREIPDFITSISSLVNDFIIFLLVTDFKGCAAVWRIHPHENDLVRLGESYKISDDPVLQGHIGSNLSSEIDFFVADSNSLMQYQVVIKEISGQSNKSDSPLVMWKHKRAIETYSPLSYITCDHHHHIVHTGMSNGNVDVHSFDSDADGFVRKHGHYIHKKKVTGIILLDSIQFTSSLDGCVKVFRMPELTQIGEFVSPSPITSMVPLLQQPQRDHYTFACGTESGMIMVLDWIVHSQQRE